MKRLLAISLLAACASGVALAGEVPSPPLQPPPACTENCTTASTTTSTTATETVIEIVVSLITLR
jgi:hypothetical protein